MNSHAHWLFNTDETEDVGEGAYEKMIYRSCIAAWGNCHGQGAEKTLQKPEKGDTVFLYCARQGIVASGQVKGQQPRPGNSIFGDDAHDEYQRPLYNLRRLERPLSVADVESKTGYRLPYRHIVCRLNNEAAVKFIIDRIENDNTIIVEDRDLSDKQLDEAIKSKTLRFKDDILAFDKKVEARRRHGMDRLRVRTLDIYCNQCALCDIADPHLLEASHIVRWADDPAARADLTNIICLCKIHHALFEHGYVALTDKLQVVKKLDCEGEMLANVLAMTSAFRIHDKHYSPNAKYLKKHRRRCNL